MLLLATKIGATRAEVDRTGVHDTIVVWGRPGAFVLDTAAPQVVEQILRLAARGWLVREIDDLAEALAVVNLLAEPSQTDADQDASRMRPRLRRLATSSAPAAPAAVAAARPPM